MAILCYRGSSVGPYYLFHGLKMDSWWPDTQCVKVNNNGVVIMLLHFVIYEHHISAASSSSNGMVYNCRAGKADLSMHFEHFH